MSSLNLLKTLDSNIGDSLLNDSGYLQVDATAKRVNQKKLENFVYERDAFNFQINVIILSGKLLMNSLIK